MSNMSYTSNPNLPKVRAEAVKMVRSGHSTRDVARHFGYSQSAVVKWCKKVHPEDRQFRVIPTDSSRPHHHPNELDKAIVERILELRFETKRGAEFIHVLMQREGIKVSLSSVNALYLVMVAVVTLNGRNGINLHLDHYQAVQET